MPRPDDTAIARRVARRRLHGANDPGYDAFEADLGRVWGVQPDEAASHMERAYDAYVRAQVSGDRAEVERTREVLRGLLRSMRPLLSDQDTRIGARLPTSQRALRETARAGRRLIELIETQPVVSTTKIVSDLGRIVDLAEGALEAAGSGSSKQTPKIASASGPLVIGIAGPKSSGQIARNLDRAKIRESHGHQATS